jgi:hypothetical protein
MSLVEGAKIYLNILDNKPTVSQCAVIKSMIEKDRENIEELIVVLNRIEDKCNKVIGESDGK